MNNARVYKQIADKIRDHLNPSLRIQVLRKKINQQKRIYILYFRAFNGAVDVITHFKSLNEIISSS